MKLRITKEEFKNKYKSMSVTQMAKLLNVSRQTIITTAKKYGLPKKKSGGAKPKKTIVISKEELENLYRTTRTVDLARMLGISIVTLLRIIKESGIKIKTIGHGVRQRKVVVEG